VVIAMFAAILVRAIRRRWASTRPASGSRLPA
jgi:hypothetical protein